MRIQGQIGIEIVGGCNLRCPSCSVGNFLLEEFVAEPRKKGLMSPELFQSIVRKLSQVSDQKMIHLYNWGDTLLHKNLPEIIKIAHEAGFNVAVSTNFSMRIDLKPIVQAMEEKDVFAVSLSGATQEIYQKGHAGGRINRVLSNFFLLREEMDLQGKSFHVRLNYHIYNDNMEDSKHIKYLCDFLGFYFDPYWAGGIGTEKWIKHAEGVPFSAADQRTIDRLLVNTSELATLTAELNDGSCNQHDSLNIDESGHIEFCCATYDRGLYAEHLNFLEESVEKIFERKQNWDYCRKCVASGTNVAFIKKPEVSKLVDDEYRRRGRSVAQDPAMDEYFPVPPPSDGRAGISLSSGLSKLRTLSTRVRTRLRRFA